MATAINFATTPRIGGVTISTSNVSRDGTGSFGTVISAGTNGTRIDRMRTQAIVTTTAGMVRLFLFDGTNSYALQEVPVAAASVTTSVAGAATDIVFGDVRPLALPNGWAIRATTHSAETITVTAFGADY